MASRRPYVGYRTEGRAGERARWIVVNALPTCAHRLEALTGCGDPLRLKSAVRELCAEFGKVTNIEILTMTEAEQRRALCFLRLESEAQEMQLMASLGVGRFGNDVLVIVDLPLATTA